VEAAPRTRYSFSAGLIGIFFACALAIFCRVSPVPVADGRPVAILASRLPSNGSRPPLPPNFALGLALATVNYQHWDAIALCRAALRGPSSGHRVWVDNDWGLRYYLKATMVCPRAKACTCDPATSS
jgi:hypothetical protein